MPHLSQPAAALDVHDVRFFPYANSASGERELAAWRAEFQPRTEGRPHTMSDEEVLYLLAGELTVEIDADGFILRAGEAMLVPAGAVLRVSNASENPASAWVVTRLGMTAAMTTTGQGFTPPWAQ